MAKFNRSMIKGLDTEAATGELKVGAGLLSEVSKGQAEMKLVYLRRDEIDKNGKNMYSIQAIDSLAWSIRVFGLLQPLHVTRKENGRYGLIGGERRLTAIDELIADDGVEKWNEDTLIPCVIKDPNDVDLPLDTELKERLSIMTTNKEARKYTDADKLMEIREWKEIIEALRAANIESLPGVDEEGNEQNIVIKGETTREILAKTTNMSRGNINKYEKVENQGSEAIKEALLNNQVSVGTAEKIVDNFNREEQGQVLKELLEGGEQITPQAVEQKVEDKKSEIPDGMTEITPAVLKKDLKMVAKLLKGEKSILG